VSPGAAADPLLGFNAPGFESDSAAAAFAGGAFGPTLPPLTEAEYAELAHPDLWHAVLPLCSPAAQAAPLLRLVARAALADMQTTSALLAALFPPRPLYDSAPNALAVPKTRLESLYPCLRVLQTLLVEVHDPFHGKRCDEVAPRLLERVIATNRYWRVSDELLWTICRLCYAVPGLERAVAAGGQAHGSAVQTQLREDLNWLEQYALPIPPLGSTQGPVYLDPVELSTRFTVEGTPRRLTVEAKRRCFRALAAGVDHPTYCAVFAEAVEESLGTEAASPTALLALATADDEMELFYQRHLREPAVSLDDFTG